ncbi:hypothetical protein CR513_05591, partial [Mucuna pruriens]
MENNDRTLKELTIPDMVYQPWCIQYLQLELAQSYKLKSDLIHLLPKFHGLAGEDPYKHLKEFHVVCSTMRSQGILEDYIKMKVFPFSLDGAAKDWLYLQPVLFNTWGDMKHMFLEKFFPASRIATIKKEICGIRQHSGEHCTSIGKDLTSYVPPVHTIKLASSLTMMDRSMIDVISGGALMDKMPTTTRHLISNTRSNTQQYGTRGVATSWMVNEVGVIDNLRLENQLTELTSLAISTECSSKSLWHLHFHGAPNQHVPPTLQETESDHPESVASIVPVKSESRAISSSKIWIRLEHASDIAVPTIVRTKSAITRQLTIFGGPDEVVGNKQPRVST